MIQNRIHEMKHPRYGCRKEGIITINRIKFYVRIAVRSLRKTGGYAPIAAVKNKKRKTVEERKCFVRIVEPE